MRVTALALAAALCACGVESEDDSESTHDIVGDWSVTMHRADTGICAIVGGADVLGLDEDIDSLWSVARGAAYWLVDVSEHPLLLSGSDGVHYDGAVEVPHQNIAASALAVLAEPDGGPLRATLTYVIPHQLTGLGDCSVVYGVAGLRIGE